MPSASRIEALSGSRRFAFSSGTVACAACPCLSARRPSLEEVVRVAHTNPRGTGSSPRIKSSGSVKSRVGPISRIGRRARRRSHAGTRSRARTAAASASERGAISSPNAHSGAAARPVRPGLVEDARTSRSRDLERRPVRRRGRQVAPAGDRACRRLAVEPRRSGDVAGREDGVGAGEEQRRLGTRRERPARRRPSRRARGWRDEPMSSAEAPPVADERARSAPPDGR